MEKAIIYRESLLVAPVVLKGSDIDKGISLILNSPHKYPALIQRELLITAACHGRLYSVRKVLKKYVRFNGQTSLREFLYTHR